ncbi:MAG: AEC family transporter, partial [Clostridia bacterium]|nr:AEC family transporter [Clostridia bacterium]
MAVFLATLSPLLMLFLCIASGFTLKKTNVLPDGAGRVIAKLETWVFVPALNFMTMVRFCTPATLTTHATNVVLGSFSVLIAMAMALVLCRFFVQKKCAERNVYCYALTFANSGYLGDPIVLALFGEGILSSSEIFDMLEYPPDKTMGDIALPCFRLSKSLRRAPVMIAAELAGAVSCEEFSSVSAV